MVDEVNLEDCLVIHARAFLSGFAGMSGMLEDLLRAHGALQTCSASGASTDPPAIRDPRTMMA